MTLSLRAMRYVQSAMRLGSISAAAERMNVAASAVATALGQAEDAFGVTLATRARAKGISPTLAGRDVQRRIDDLLERYDAMLADVSTLKGGLSGVLTIGYNAPIAPAFLPGIVADMRAEHPEIAISFVDGDNMSVQDGLLSGQFDAIVFVEELPNPQIETLPLIFAPTYCLCPADHPIAKGVSVSVAEILCEPLVLLDRPAARGYYMELLEQSGDDYRIVATANSTEMVRSLVAAGTGISLLSMRPGERPAYSGSHTRCVPIAGSGHGVTLSLGFAPGPKRRLLQLFVETCSAFFQTDQSAGLIVSPQN
ncbi:MAG: LysR family transcriptional regulator [Pseudomonadota bacterium]